MEETSQDPHRNYSKEKKFMKSKESSNIENEDEDTNIISNGKDIHSPTRRGNQNWHFPMMAIFSIHISNNTNSKYEHQQQLLCLVQSSKHQNPHLPSELIEG